jgi:hypothetical protein
MLSKRLVVAPGARSSIDPTMQDDPRHDRDREERERSELKHRRLVVAQVEGRVA